MLKNVMVSVFFQLLLICNVAIAENSIQEFTTKYTQASSEDQRLQLCLDAINQGLVYRGMPLADIDKLFGTTYNSERLASRQMSGEGVVNFIPFEPSPRDDMAAGSEGWYLAFTFGPSGFIENYYLTNLHK